MFTLKRKSAWLSLCALLLCAPLWAQKMPLTLQLRDKNREPLSFATVSVLRAADTTKKMETIADESGRAVFELDTAAYIVKVSAVNYKPLRETIVLGAGRDSFTLTLQASGETLNEVEIRSSASLMRQVDDKTVVDPEQLAASSTNGYEVLEKTPGIFIDQDGNIYLNSTTPASIYINGKEMKMSRSDIATMLRNLPPGAIQKIEILRTPSARYDASGSGGVVNIVLKKGVKPGLTGSINGSVQQGKKGNQQLGINLSNNDGRNAVYLNLNYNHRDGYEQLNTDRFISGDTFLSQQAHTTLPGNNWYLGYGWGRDLDDKWNLSYDGRLNYTNSFNKTDNTNSFKVAPEAAPLGQSNTYLKNDNYTFLLSQELNSVYKIDTLGSEWTNSLSYIYSSNDIDQGYTTYALSPYSGGGAINGRRHVLTGLSDLSYKLPHRITLETGVKSSLLIFNNSAAYYLDQNGNRFTDKVRSNDYNYKEWINAAYIQASKGLGSFLLKAGVRMENTNMSGLQRLPADTSFSIHRTDFFPYVYLSRKVMSIAGYEIRAYLVYRRTISRPTYEQLNPYPKYVDQFLSEAGNPTLRPQFTHNYEANISITERPLFAIGFNDTRDMFTNVYYQADSNTAQAYRTYDNVGRNKEFYLRGFAAIPPGGTYFFVVGGQYNYNIYEGLYEGQPLSFKRGGWLFFTYHQLRIDKRSQITLNGFLRLKGPLQFYELSSMGALNLNVNRKFFKDKLTVTLSANDIFFTNNNTFTINQGSVRASGYRESDSRRVGISFRYNFGIRKEERADMFQQMQQPAGIN
ncbi:TonB-dependent receptor domain-containing protein [Taibaiella chishuiensis]|uniref:Outer membrane receptor protein involved in Fe transport n=1 Tax=Taibaiella chishuiensis TaxID=1434707 RepID=A0A2P8D1G2_9BACT|nr:TonB-dependent receptor [Taibaiella chishuiensis]PSK91070.1 outer membrane receptor protein involved in Fe transport [Taibaiella chishuiensis]